MFEHGLSYDFMGKPRLFTTDLHHQLPGSFPRLNIQDYSMDRAPLFTSCLDSLRLMPCSSAEMMKWRALFESLFPGSTLPENVWQVQRGYDELLQLEAKLDDVQRLKSRGESAESFPEEKTPGDNGAGLLIKKECLDVFGRLQRLRPDKAHTYLEMLEEEAGLSSLLDLDLFLEEFIPQLKKVLLKMHQFLSNLHAYFNSFMSALSYPSILDDLICEYPRNVRHCCTTMPWTIRTALVVLWGICWMFYPFSAPHAGTSPSAPSSDYAHDPFGLYGSYDAFALDFDHEAVSSFMGDEVLGDGDNLLLSALPTAALPEAEAESQYMMTSSQNSNADQPSNNLVLAGPHGPLNVLACADRETAPAPASMTSTPNREESLALSERSPSLACRHCSQTLSNTFVLRRHEKEQHGQQTYPCPHAPCKRSEHGKPFKRAANLKRHLPACKHRGQSSGGARDEKEVAGPLRHVGGSGEAAPGQAVDAHGRGVERLRRKRDAMREGIEADEREVLALRRELEEKERHLEERERELELKRQRFETVESCIQEFDVGQAEEDS